MENFQGAYSKIGTPGKGQFKIFCFKAVSFPQYNAKTRFAQNTLEAQNQWTPKYENAPDFPKTTGFSSFEKSSSTYLFICS